MRKSFISCLVLLICSCSLVAQPTVDDVSALWHFDGDYYETMQTGSVSLGWYGEYFTDEQYKVGYGAVDCVGHQGRIQLAGDAAINGDDTFGIAFWVYREEVGPTYDSVISFGTGKFEIEHVSPEADHYFICKSGGFSDFGGTYGHFVNIPEKEWTHVAITADGVTARVVINGATTYAKPQSGSGLNGSDVLWLGCETGAAGGYLDCYIDELVISNKAVGEAWAHDIYNATVGGRGLLIPSNCENLTQMGLGYAGDINMDCQVNLVAEVPLFFNAYFT